jgi:hypothetical protein
MLTLETRIDSLESILGQFIVHTDVCLKRLEREMSEFKNEMAEFKNEMSEFKNETRRDRIAMNKQWAHLAQKMGTLEEDLIAPAVRPALARYFACEPTYTGIRIRKRVGGEDFEIDMLAASESRVFMVEVKSTPKSEHVDEILQKAARLPEFFPEYNGLEVVPVFGSILFPENVMKYATKRKLYVMAYREWDYVDILNFREVSGEASGEAEAAN